jgi:hypothetical protein
LPERQLAPASALSLVRQWRLGQAQSLSAPSQVELLAELSQLTPNRWAVMYETDGASYGKYPVRIPALDRKRVLLATVLTRLIASIVLGTAVDVKGSLRRGGAFGTWRSMFLLYRVPMFLEQIVLGQTHLLNAFSSAH